MFIYLYTPFFKMAANILRDPIYVLLLKLEGQI